MPMHGPQADSRIRAPDAIRSASAPFRAIISKTCLEPGEITRLTDGMDRLALQRARDDHQVAQRGVRAASDGDLIHLRALDFAQP